MASTWQVPLMLPEDTVKGRQMRDKPVRAIHGNSCDEIEPKVV
jgi:hypothetical protein